MVQVVEARIRQTSDARPSDVPQYRAVGSGGVTPLNLFWLGHGEDEDASALCSRDHPDSRVDHSPRASRNNNFHNHVLLLSGRLEEDSN